MNSETNRLVLFESIMIVVLKFLPIPSFPLLHNHEAEWSVFFYAYIQTIRKEGSFANPLYDLFIISIYNPDENLYAL